jgi:hypothetical protein
MVVRRSASVLGLAVGLVLLIGSVAFADTTGGNADRWTAAASWGDGGVGGANVTGIIDRDLGISIEYDFYHEVALTCDDGSSGYASTSFFGESPASVAIDKKLSSALGSGTVSGTQDTYDSCTGESAETNVSYQVAFALRATSGTTSTVTKSKQTLPDGTKAITTTSVTDRDATGSVRIDGGDPITPDTGQLQHLVVVTK